jgi:hypothetical protein
MKHTISAVILVALGFTHCMAQGDFQIDSYYFTNSQGLDVSVNGRSAGTTPVNLSLPVGQLSTVEFRGRTGNSTMTIKFYPEQVSSVRGTTSRPNWYNNERLAAGYSGYTLASASASSRSLSISINKARNDAFGNLSRMIRGNRQPTARAAPGSPSVPGAQVLECYIYFDDTGYLAFLLVGAN